MKSLLKSTSKTLLIGLCAGTALVGVAFADVASTHNGSGSWSKTTYDKKAAAFAISQNNAMVTPSPSGNGSVVVYLNSGNNGVHAVDVEGPGGKVLASANSIVQNSNNTYTATVPVDNANITLIINANGSVQSATVPSGTTTSGQASRVVSAAGA